MITAASGSSKNALLIFVKYPEPGKVKTRLASAIGDAAAATLYRMIAYYSITMLDAVPAAQIVCFSPAARKDDITAWLGPSRTFSPQRGRDLGGRMSRAFEYAFSRGASKVIAVGTDCPGLTARMVRRAFRMLDNAACVVGPAQDGGYYLIGLTHGCTEIFQGIAWSSEHVAAQTVLKLRALGLSYAMLPERFDIDTVEDARRWYRMLTRMNGLQHKTLSQTLKNLLQ